MIKIEVFQGLMACIAGLVGYLGLVFTPLLFLAGQMGLEHSPLWSISR